MIRRLKDLIRQQPWLPFACVAMAVFVGLRLWRLGFPTDTVFDEVYFPKMAHQYLIGESFFDIHPPLGKLFIAAAEALFGNTPVGWRVVSLVTGLAMLPVAYFTAWQIFADRRAAWLASFLVAVDGLFIVYSRTGLMDGFMILFGLAALGFGWQFRRRRLAGQSAWQSLFLTGFFAGLAVAIKWIGIGFWPVVAGTTFLTLLTAKKRRLDFADWLVWLASFLLIPALLYTVPFLANWRTDFWHQFWLWHQQSWGYNIHLDATHPYASKWWSWPFLIRPIWFYYQNNLGRVIGVDAIGNPVVWWASTVAVVYTILVLAYTALVWRRPTTAQVLPRAQVAPLLYLLAGWAMFYLPWSRVGRVLFLYHYFGSYLFAVLLTAFWLSQARRLILPLLVMAVLAGLAFAPIWLAYPIPQTWFDHLMWFRSWI